LEDLTDAFNGVETLNTTLQTLTPCFRYKGKTWEERLVIFKETPMNIHINGELSSRQFY